MVKLKVIIIFFIGATANIASNGLHLFASGYPETTLFNFSKACLFESHASLLDKITVIPLSPQCEAWRVSEEVPIFPSFIFEGFLDIC